MHPVPHSRQTPGRNAQQKMKMPRNRYSKDQTGSMPAADSFARWAGLGAALLLVIGAIPAAFCRSLEETIERKFPCKANPEVHIRSFNGRIEIRSAAEGVVRATVTKHVYRLTGLGAEQALDSVEVLMVQDGNRFTIEANGPRARMLFKCTGALIFVEVPPGARVTAETSNASIETAGIQAFQSLRTEDGPVSVHDARGEVEVETTNGAVEVELEEGSLRAVSSNARLDVDGRSIDVDATTSNGPIEIQVEGGSVRARTSSGRIDVEGEAASVDLETSNGAIELELRGRPSEVQARTSNGSIEFEGRPVGDSLLRTSNGSIRVEMPEDVQVRLEASTTNGRINSEIAFDRTDSSTPESLIGQIGADSPATLKLHTTNGSIHLDRD